MNTHKATSCTPVFFSRVFWQSCVFTFHSSDIPFLKPLPGKDKEGKCSEICDSLHRVGWSLIIFRGGQNINIFHIYNWTPAVEVKLDRWDSGQGPNWHFGAVHWPVTMSKHHMTYLLFTSYLINKNPKNYDCKDELACPLSNDHVKTPHDLFTHMTTSIESPSKCNGNVNQQMWWECKSWSWREDLVWHLKALPIGNGQRPRK